MGIEMIGQDGRACPFAVCDRCGEIISDAGEANVEWQGESFSDGSRFDFRIVHKPSVCQVASIREGEWKFWTPLDLWLKFLMTNAGSDAHVGELDALSLAE